MKPLFDQNLSPRLAGLLADLFPGSCHVMTPGLDSASDDVIWDHARDQGYVIVSKDADYDDMAVLRGSPPKVLWLQTGNCSTARIVAILRGNHQAIEAFGNDPLMTIFCVR